MTITGTNSPVDEGNQLRVTVEVRNNGPSDDSRRVALDIDGTERDDTTVSVGNRTATTETLTWNTNDGDNGSYTATVHTDESPDNNDSTPVKVNTTVAPPSIDVFNTAQRPGSKSGIDVNWEVSAGAAELDTVEIEVYDQNGVLTGGSITNVSGTSASGSERFEPLADGRDHEVVLTVTDVDGESETQSKTQTAG
jgi:subtilisin